MPRKFASENTKAVAARERKKQLKEVADQKKERELEDAIWKDDNKQLQKKQQKKEAEEKKKNEALQRKAEAKALLEKEMAEAAKKSAKAAPPPPKITRAQIAQTSQVKPKEKEEKKIETHLDVPLVENVNRLQIDGEEARTVEEAIRVLNIDSVDLIPEKSMKAAYTAYEKRRLQELKLEYPTLRLSQLKQRIFTEWQRSPENPMNQKF